MTITLKRTVNLSEPILPEVLSAPLYEGEKNAHTFMITAEKDKLPHALSGSVVAYFERNDGNTVRVEGETKDGAAILTLSPECYQTGVFYLAIMLISDGAQTVIYAASGRVRNTQDGEIINGGDAIPSYDEIMAHLNKYLSTDITAKVEETEDGALITMKDVVNGETVALVKNGAKGDPGFSPTAKVTQTADGTTVEVTDKNGTTSAKIKNGQPGDPGFSPTAKVTQTADGATIEITDKGGTTSAIVKNGKDGAPGETNVFIVREIINGISDKSKEEAEAAAKAGKAVLLVTQYGEVYTYYAKEKNPDTSVYELLFVMPITKAATGKRRSYIFLGADNALTRKSETPFKAIAENPLTIKTANAEIEYDGSEKKEIDLSDLGSGGSGGAEKFYINVTEVNGVVTKVNKTINEIDAAYASGKELICALMITITDEDGKIIAGFPYRIYLFLDHAPAGNSSYVFSRFKKLAVGSSPYEDLRNNYLEIEIHKGDNNETKVEVKKARYAKFDEIPEYLPNRYKLNISQGLNRWSYSGEETVNVNLPEIPTSIPWDAITNKPVIPEPVTSLPWSAITDKPFDYGVALDMEIGEGFDGNIYTPFTLKANTNYRITLKAGNAVITEQATSIAHNFNGLKIVALGNLGLMGDQSMNTGEGFLVVNIPGAEMMNPTVVYGMAVLNPYAYPDVNFGDGAITGRFVIENIDEFKPVPEDLIPTMSETTKGGAMVGKGIKMVGDALTVDGVDVKNAGKLLYVNDNGTLSPLTLGTGLKIVNGVLTIEASVARAVAGMALAGQVKVGEV